MIAQPQLHVSAECSLGGIGLSITRHDDKKPIWKYTKVGYGVLAGQIGSLLNQGLSETGNSLKNVTKIAVSVGPGSFTGIRIGLSWALGCSATRLVSVKAYSSLLEIFTQMDHLKPAEETYSQFALLFPNTQTHGFWVDQNGAKIIQYKLLEKQLVETTEKNTGNENFKLLAIEIDNSQLINYLGAFSKIQLEHWSRQEAIEKSLEFMHHNLAIDKPSLDFDPIYLRLSTAEERLQANA